MNLEELRELFRDMLSKGLKPMYCDTSIPLYDSPVPCGEPAKGYEDIVDRVSLPKELLSMHPEFMVPVRGDSMKDVGIVTGDVVRVIGDVTACDGDIVLANIDGEYTLKTYFEDEEGRRWLVPQNEKYQPILLDGQHNVRILGRVKEVVKTAPRVSSRACMKAINKALQNSVEPKKITRQQVERAIITVAPMVKNGRQWYAVFRALVDKNVLKKNDYDGFCQMVARVVPEHEHLPEAGQMQRLAVQSFAKPIVLWDKYDAPVKNKPFDDYLSIAEETLEQLSL